MFLADLRTAYGKAPQAAVLDQLARKRAHGPLEGAARAGPLQRLLFLALAQQLLHLGKHGSTIAAVQNDRDRQDAPAGILFKNTGTIAHSQIRRRQRTQL